ncbi:MAG: hypothetical protein JW717_01860 [Marinilabiliaceae bacterium]|nr:hypothetical protein [Marinilabiliaceae bacterium]
MIKTKIIAHRGESFLAPENTLPAIELAWKNDITDVEIDIQLTNDNHIVVFHDYKTKRIGNRDKYLKTQTLSQLMELDAGTYKDAKYAGTKIPTLKEVLTNMPPLKRLIIEIKHNIEIIPHLISLITKYHLTPNQVEFIAFDFNIITELKNKLPKYKCLLLLDLDYERPYWMIWINKEKLIKKIIKYNIDGIDIWAGKLLNQKFIKPFKDAGLYVYTWTVNDINKAKELIKIGVDGITTDRASWMKEKINE